MPNGKPGNRPDTDIYLHGIDVYDDQEINDMIRELYERADDFHAAFGINLYYYGRELTDEEHKELKEALTEALEELDE